MNVNRYTERTQEALVQAQGLAQRHRNSDVQQAHVLLALLDQEGGVASSILQRLGVDISSLRRQVESEVERLPAIHGSNVQPAFSASVAEILQQAQDIA